MPLFESEPHVPFLLPAKHSEDTYHYYSRSTRPEITTIREKINQLYDEYPDGQHKLALASQMRTTSQAFNSGFFELYLYGLFTRLGCQVTPEPDPGQGATSKPDFLIELPSGYSVYIEAVSLEGKSPQERRQDIHLATLYDYIDEKLVSPQFLWGIEIKRASEVPPRAKRTTEQLQKYVNKLDWNTLSLLDNPSQLDEYAYDIESNGWIFEFKPIPKKKSSWGNASRPLGLFPIQGGWSITKSQIQDQISSKRRQHKILNHPLVIAINAGQFDADVEDFFDAAFGTEALTVSYDHNYKPIKTSMTRNDDGALSGKSSKKNDHIPYLLCFRRLFPNTIGSVQPVIILNPNTQQDSPLVLPDIRCMSHSGEIKAGRRGWEIFGLADTWPG